MTSRLIVVWKIDRLLIEKGKEELNEDRYFYGVKLRRRKTENRIRVNNGKYSKDDIVERGYV